MKGGDLSNDVAPYVAFSFDRVVKRQDGRLDSKAKNIILNFIDGGYNNILLLAEDRRKCMAFCVKWGVPWNQVVEVESILEIPQVCREMNVIMYWDTNANVLTDVRARGVNQIRTEQWIPDTDY